MNPLVAIFSLLLSVSTLTALGQKTAIHEDIHAEFKKGLALFDDGFYTAAREKFEEVISRHPFENREGESAMLRENALFYQAFSALKTGHPDAVYLFEEFIEKSPGSQKARLAYYYLGEHFYQNRKYDDAIAYFKQVDIGDLGNEQITDYKFKLAYSYFYKKDLEKAQKLFYEIKNIENDHYLPANYYYGYIAYFNQNYEEALEHFLKVVDSKMYGFIVPYYIANIYLVQGKYDKVISYATPLVSNNNLLYRDELHKVIGQAYFKKENYKKAQEYLSYYIENSAKVEREDVYQLAYAQYQTGNYEAAIERFQDLAYLKDSLGQNALYNLANSYLKTGEKSKAQSAFMEAARLDYDPVIKETAAFNAAKLSYELGYQNMAIRQLQNYINTYTNKSNIQEARELLTGIFLSTRNYKDALQVIESIENKTPRIKEAYQKVAYYRGVELFNNRSFNEALQHFNTSLNYPIDPTIHALNHYWKGELFYLQGQYDKAIGSLSRFIELSRTGIKLPEGVTRSAAHYTLAYSFFNQEDYQRALTYFTQSLQDANPNTAPDKAILPDATIRTADSYFMLRNYPNAIAFYNKAVENNYPRADYALFQKGILLGLQNQLTAQIEALQQLQNKYPGSNYADDALFEVGNAYLAQAKYDLALQSFNRLPERYPNSSFVPEAMLKSALIHYNKDETEKALALYRDVVQKYPKTEPAREALLGIKNIFIEEGNPEGYIAYLKELPDVDITISEQDSITYLSAEMLYGKGNCEKAVIAFTSYLEKFPEGYFTAPVHFYRGECLYNQKAYERALQDYEFILARQPSSFSEKALLKAARISYYTLNNYEKAYQYYSQIYPNTAYKEYQEEALQGLLKSAFFTNRHEQVKEFAPKVLALQQLNKQEQAEVLYFSGKASLALKDTAGAKAAFKQAIALTTNKKTAETQYLIGQIHFRQDSIEKARAAALEVINQSPAYEEWVVRSFILLADIYIKKEELFQAKATLQSVIDNYKGDDKAIIEEAQNKLNEVLRIEAEASKIRQDTLQRDTLLMEMDTLKQTLPDTLKQEGENE